MAIHRATAIYRNPDVVTPDKPHDFLKAPE